MKLDRKICVITGGASGIGLEIPKYLAAAGVKVVIVSDRSMAELAVGLDAQVLPPTIYAAQDYYDGAANLRGVSRK